MKTSQPPQLDQLATLLDRLAKEIMMMMGGLAALPQTFVDTLYRTAFEKRDENMPASTIQLVVNLLVQGFHRKEI